MYTKREHIHFVGIGGIGMSGIAHILKRQGYTVSGCDIALTSPIIEGLRNIGCSVYDGHSVDHVHHVDVLVFSSMVDQEHPEVLAGIKKGIPVIPRALMLAELMRTKYSVAIAGSHGKTTTTSLIAHILIEAQKDPTVIVGGVLKNLSSQAQFGNGDLLIAEADESDRSFLYLNPTMAVVTNIGAEHLDTYKDLDDVKKTFRSFLERLPFYGKAFLCIDDPIVRSMLPLQHISVVTYGLDQDARVRGDFVNHADGSSSLCVHVHAAGQQGLLGPFQPRIFGEHNARNIVAAVAVCAELGVDLDVIGLALEKFKGIERRFEFKGMCKGAEVFDDYGHHPTEIAATLKVAARRAKKRVHILFQPHRFTRTERLWHEFIHVFAYAVQQYQLAGIYVADIYPAFEQPIAGVTSERLVHALLTLLPTARIHYQHSFEAIASLVYDDVQAGDLILTLGAGCINQVGTMLVRSTATEFVRADSRNLKSYV